MNYKGSVWIRKSDLVSIRILADAECGSRRSSRSLRAINLDTGRHFWVTPEGIQRKYFAGPGWEHPEENE
ncbi:hypothetical protein SEA_WILLIAMBOONE_119 [Gordonia phage WilliamBoone]|nr:hypothetical protein SEA_WILLIAMBOONE_119 [Gordonia phage WilliamBoone]